ncbi:hypothetical protein LCGC14_0927080 [marine sediment metagenome]|uniref:Uncharacterized protein n=1 Tax=marine sediment metagenome TaxID=412755 RepID=A0A0F9PA12_9ZZZZ
MGGGVFHEDVLNLLEGLSRDYRSEMMLSCACTIPHFQGANACLSCPSYLREYGTPVPPDEPPVHHQLYRVIDGELYKVRDSRW